MSKVFISWSKAKSKEFAIETKRLLETLDPKIAAFVSEVDIAAGVDVQTKIVESITDCDILVLCFTSENKLSPWLLFEAGYARGLQKTVIPILFDEDPNWHSWIDNPMNIVREIRVSDKGFISRLLSCFEIAESGRNQEATIHYTKAITQIDRRFKLVDAQCEDLVEILINNNAFKLNNPYFRDRTAHFLSGFESFDLLKVLTESFLYSGKYFWIYGRKNMKLFGGSFKSFFDYLHEKALGEYEEMDGISFRCLFLDPTSDEVKNAHVQQEIFLPELESTILRAKVAIGDSSRLQKCFRLYSNKRDEIIIRLDNSIVYSKPTFDAHGRPQLLTNSSFEVFGISTAKGKRCIEKYNRIWEDADPMF